METSKLLIASVTVAFIVYFVGANSDTEKLRYRISAIESSISDIVQEIKGRDDSNSKFEILASEKLERIDSLQREIDLVQMNCASDVEVAMRKSQSQVSELEKQVNRLKCDIKEQDTKRASLETQAYETDKKVQELVLKLESIQKIYEEQKLRERNTECALKEAEEELMKAQLEAASKSKQMIEKWIPTAKVQFWSFASSFQSYAQVIFAKSIEVYGVSKESLATHIVQAREVADPYFQFQVPKKLSKPYIDQIAYIAKPHIEKLLFVMSSYQKWTESNLHSARAKWIPTAKDQFWRFASSVQPYAQVIFAKTIEVYRVSKESLATYIVQARELADPYFQYQDHKKLSKLYIDQIANLAKPHVEKLLLVMNSYHGHAVHSYKLFVTILTSYHDQVRSSVHENLKKCELTKAFAKAELEWFLALALLAFPVFFLCRLLRACFV